MSLFLVWYLACICLFRPKVSLSVSETSQLRDVGAQFGAPPTSLPGQEWCWQTISTKVQALLPLLG